MPPERRSADHENRVVKFNDGAPPMPPLAINGVEINAQVRTYLNTDG